MTITADCAGSNGARLRLWKVELHKLADETGLTVRVRHYPPGTSRWNKIEHRLFCHITQNWRGRPLTDHLAVVELIGAATTTTGPKVECAIDPRTYQKGVKVEDAVFDAFHLVGDWFHPEYRHYRLKSAVRALQLFDLTRTTFPKSRNLPQTAQVGLATFRRKIAGETRVGFVSL